MCDETILQHPRFQLYAEDFLATWFEVEQMTITKILTHHAEMDEGQLISSYTAYMEGVGYNAFSHRNDLYMTGIATVKDNFSFSFRDDYEELELMVPASLVLNFIELTANDETKDARNRIVYFVNEMFYGALGNFYKAKKEVRERYQRVYAYFSKHPEKIKFFDDMIMHENEDAYASYMYMVLGDKHDGLLQVVDERNVVLSAFGHHLVYMVSSCSEFRSS